MPNSFKAYALSSGNMLSIQLLDASGNTTNVISYNPLASQTLEMHAASGYFQVGKGGFYTTPIPIGSTAATLKTALEALPTIGSNNVDVDFFGYPYKITFKNALAGSQPLLATTVTGLLALGSTVSTVSGTGPRAIYDATVATSGVFTLAGSGWVNQSAPFGTSWKVPATGTGLNAARWSIPGLNTGAYNVYYSSSGLAGSTVSRTTPFRFFDGITPRQSLSVNEQDVNPAIVFPGLDAAGFQLLATIAVTNPNHLNILVSDEVDIADVNQLVVVNEIAVVPIDPFAPVYYAFSDSGNTPYVVLTGTWSSFGGGWNSDEHFTSITPGNSLWTFSGLLSNCAYSFQVYWTEGGTRTSAAVYNVYDSDGTTLLGTATLNQQNPSSGGATLRDNNSNPFTFTPIGTFTVTGTYAYISLDVSNDGSNITMSEAAACILQTPQGYHETISSSVQNYSIGPPNVTVNGGSSFDLNNAIWSFNPDLLFPIMDFPFSSPTLTPSDVITITLSDNCIGTKAGAIPGVTHQSVTNVVGLGRTVTPQPAATDHTMGMGYNLMALGYGHPLYSNLVKSTVGLDYSGQINANRYPISRVANSGVLLFGTDESPLNSEGYPRYPIGGISTMTWDGDAGGSITLIPFAGTSVAFHAMNTGHATGNYVQIVFTLDGSGDTLAPQFTMQLNLLTDYADDADAGRFSTTGAWTTINGQGYNGTVHKSDGTPSPVAFFSLGHVPAGTYQVSNTWVADALNCGSVFVNVKESNVSIHTYNIDQTVAPANFPAFDYNRNLSHFDPTNQTFTCSGGPIVISLQGDGSGFVIADCVQISIVGSITSLTPFAPFSNLGLYDPTVNWPSQPKFHPIYKKAVLGSKTLRTMQLMGSNNGSQYRYQDFPTANTLSYGAGAAINLYPLLKVENWNNADGFFKPGYTAALFTVDATGSTGPLPFADGVPVILPGNVIPTCSMGGSVNFSFYYESCHHASGSMAPNQFAMATNAPSCVGTINTLTPTFPDTTLGNATTSYVCVPPRDIFEFGLEVGAVVWFNVTVISDQGCIEGCADDHMAATPPGTMVRLEIGNEPWNSAFGYPFYQYYDGLHYTLGLPDTQTAYAMKASQIHTWFHDRLATQGRGNELIRGFNCQFADIGTTSSVYTYCNNNGKLIDEIWVAPYVNIFPSFQPGQESIYDNMTAAQLCDALDAAIGLGNHYQPALTQYLASVNQQAINSGHPCRLAGYEGSIATMEIGGSDCTVREMQAIAAIYWPQIYYITKAYIGMYQQYGNLSVENVYSLDQPAVNDGGNCISAVYGKNMWYTFEPGIGDGSDGKHDNRPDLLGAPPSGPNWNLEVTPTAAAVQWWNGIGGSKSIFAYLRRMRIQ